MIILKHKKYWKPKWYIDNLEQANSIFDKIIIAKDDELKVVVIIISYF